MSEDWRASCPELVTSDCCVDVDISESIFAQAIDVGFDVLGSTHVIVLACVPGRKLDSTEGSPTLGT